MVGMEVFSPSQLLVGLNSNIQFNRFGNKIYFGNAQVKDSFQSTSPAKLCNEFAIKKMISDNPEVRKILASHRIPARINMAELQDLMENHCKDTQNISVEIYKNLPQALKQQVNIADLKDGALLHDFGKSLIPPEILNKNGALTEDEHKIMDLHSELGYQLLKTTGLNDKVLNLVRFHHHNYETNDKAAKNFIPDINLQIINLADKYSALTEKRVYKEAFSPKKALTIIYSDVKDGKVHPFLFQALVKAVSEQNEIVKVS